MSVKEFMTKDDLRIVHTIVDIMSKAKKEQDLSNKDTKVLRNLLSPATHALESAFIKEFIRLGGNTDEGESILRLLVAMATMAGGSAYADFVEIEEMLK